MNKKILFVPFLVFIAACAPSAVQIQTTVQAAIVQTETAMPTATLTFTPTLTPTPTETPQPSPIPRTKQLMDSMNITIQFMDVAVEIIDIRYIDGRPGKRSILQIDAKSIADEYDTSAIVPAILTTLHKSYNDGYKFEDGLFALNKVEYDKNLTRQGLGVVYWEDIFAWFEDEISAEELVQRFIILP